jgi:hypothetical protein
MLLRFVWPPVYQVRAEEFRQFTGALQKSMDKISDCSQWAFRICNPTGSLILKPSATCHFGAAFSSIFNDWPMSFAGVRICKPKRVHSKKVKTRYARMRPSPPTFMRILLYFIAQTGIFD